MKAVPYGNVAKRLLQRYWRLSRGLTLGIRAAVIDGEDRVLLVRHTYTRGWHFPGGGVEFNETVYDALVRELSEEAGVTVAGGAPELFGIYANAEQFPGDHVLLFVVREWHSEGRFVPNREIAEASFFAQEALPERTTCATLRRLDELNRRRDKATTW